MANDRRERSPYDLASELQGILVSRATSGRPSDLDYRRIRGELIRLLPESLVPDIVRHHHDLDSFWGFISSGKGDNDRPGAWGRRRRIIHEQFRPLLDHLQNRNAAPGDQDIGSILDDFSLEGVKIAWDKAVRRRAADPDGAITMARTLLESVCKHILDDMEVQYTEKDDLPKLYKSASEELNLAPNQHTERPIKEILGSATNIVNGLGTLRNRLSDAHGQGKKLPVKPSPRHASLAVNVAGAVAMFLIETAEHRKASGSNGS